LLPIKKDDTAIVIVNSVIACLLVLALTFLIIFVCVTISKDTGNLINDPASRLREKKEYGTKEKPVQDNEIIKAIKPPKSKNE